jgi:general stress protein YciG
MSDADPTDKKLRGFAAMDPKTRSAVGRKGGKASHANGTGHEFTPAEARAAGRKGAAVAHRRRREQRAQQIRRGEDR